MNREHLGAEHAENTTEPPQKRYLHTRLTLGFFED